LKKKSASESTKSGPSLGDSGEKKTVAKKKEKEKN